MSRDAVNRICAALPGSEKSDPWGGGHDCWKVGGKMFAVIGASDDHGVSLKCADTETADLLIEMGRAEKAPYLHASWVRIRWGGMEEDELAERLRRSYELIRSKLSGKIRAAL
ncbi:MmcQ/YjbR family DNA-binding protein [Hoeflea marina]|uniref:MmcQ/YjbR family DNA-binding protein n=1 Tax=Hoeflea marina TaxID=274592 RepID=UPI000D715FED|nr:MmcQ/YjbR family DNA-binding protein [Hoeflea marina]